MKTVSIKHTYWDIAADIYFPDDFNSEKKYPAIISAHPIGSCKEQTSGSVYGLSLIHTPSPRDRQKSRMPSSA